MKLSHINTNPYFPKLSHGFSYGFPMVFPAINLHFPMVFRYLPWQFHHGIPSDQSDQSYQASEASEASETGSDDSEAPTTGIWYLGTRPGKLT